jgi:hypothetical protein
MTPLPIAAVSSFAQIATETPASLREQVKALCPRAPRRINRLTELGLIGAQRCVLGRELPLDTAVYMAFTSGCIADSVALVRDVVRGTPPMPVTFINVSSNMAGFYIASSLGLHSGNQVVSCNDFAWEAALELAMLSPARGLLLGAVEECAWPLAEHRERLGLPPGAPLLETSHWLLADREIESPIATLQWLRRFSGDAALFEFLGQQSWPRDTLLNVQNADGAQIAQKLGLKLNSSDSAGHSGMPAALACVRFIEQLPGAGLLHLNRGRDGAWYASLWRGPALMFSQ